MSRKWLSICHCKRLFRIVIFSDEISIDWAVNDKSNDVSNWQIEATYASRARCATYCFFEINANLILFLKLIIAMSTFLINWKWSNWEICLKEMSFSWRSMIVSLNFNEEFEIVSWFSHNFNVNNRFFFAVVKFESIKIKMSFVCMFTILIFVRRESSFKSVWRSDDVSIFISVWRKQRS